MFFLQPLRYYYLYERNFMSRAKPRLDPLRIASSIEHISANVYLWAGRQGGGKKALKIGKAPGKGKRA